MFSGGPGCALFPRTPAQSPGEAGTLLFCNPRPATRSQPPEYNGAMSETAPSFDDGLDRLEALVRQLETGSLGLEEALARFEEGIALSQQLQAQLAEAQRRVEVLKQGLGGEYRAEPLDGEGN